MKRTITIFTLPTETEVRVFGDERQAYLELVDNPTLDLSTLSKHSVEVDI
jgi:hypothetical protein